MAITVLIDHNIEGQARRLWTALAESGWAQVAELSFVYFAEAGLPNDSADRVVWRFAQAHQMYLLTANRNNDDADSLEQTLQDENTASSLPVINVRRPQRIYEKAYREACAERLLEIVLYPEEYLGTKRQFIP